MNIIYYIILAVTVISYVLGLFLSYFERKGNISVLSGLGNAGFINIFGESSQNIQEEDDLFEKQQELRQQMQELQELRQFESQGLVSEPDNSLSRYIDEEII